MRTIRIVALLLFLIGLLIPQFTWASQATDPDTNTKSTFEKIAAFFSPQEVQAAPQEQPQPTVEQPKDERTEQILAQWKEKQIEKWNALPTGSFEINASAYTAAADECGNNKGVTASGVKVQTNRTIACPPTLPFGAKIEIEGLGTYVCEDRGGAIKGNKIDIYVQTKTEAFAFGRQHLMAKVVF